MHLLSSPAHLFSVVLLSIALGVMTMAVPLTIRDTDIGKWQWHSKRRGPLLQLKVTLVRRYGPEPESSTEDNRQAAYSKFLHNEEHWYLYITQYCGFHAVQDNQLWRLRKVVSKIPVVSKFSVGQITSTKDVTISEGRKEALYSEIEKITGHSQFEALNAMIDFLKTEIPKGMAYTPRSEDPDAWTKIFLAMTNHDQYLKEFPGQEDPYIRLPDGTTDAQRAASISEGTKRKLTSDRQRKSKKIKAQMGVSNLLG
ncbi:hypothetical protein F5050DRAFT_1895909 [Lentinula boryana]|uniref:Uncharacterized protein n=1 Tax=Lentinula boryana TaxID=40481 RepID=A0ABQ8Q9S1_9AGAR|nr:hypothetical protein F5050DRAFT_1895909 [Lentinula boryana]